MDSCFLISHVISRLPIGRRVQPISANLRTRKQTNRKSIYQEHYLRYIDSRCLWAPLYSDFGGSMLGFSTGCRYVRWETMTGTSYASSLQQRSYGEKKYCFYARKTVVTMTSILLMWIWRLLSLGWLKNNCVIPVAWTMYTHNINCITVLAVSTFKKRFPHISSDWTFIPKTTPCTFSVR